MLRPTCSSTASGDGDLARLAGAAFERRAPRRRCCIRRMMFRLDGVDASARRRSLARDQAALMHEAAARGRHRFPRQGAILRPQKQPERMARQRHAAPQRRRPRGGRHRRRATQPPARSKAGGRSSTTCASCVPGAGFRAAYIARDRAAAGHARDPARASATTCCRPRTCWAAPLSTTPSASTPGRWSSTSPATSSGAGRADPRLARLQPAALAHAGAAAHATTCWWPAAARR